MWKPWTCSELCPRVENEPAEVIADEVVEPESPAVVPEVERAARALAERVWSLGALAQA